MKIETMEARQKIKMGIAKLMLSQPFFATALIGIKIEEDTRTRTMATDGRGLYYNAGFVASMTMEQLIFVLAHEALHILLMHPLRMTGKEHKLSNIAGDFVVNGILRRVPMTLLSGALYDDEYSAKGQSMETVYATLLSKRPKPQQQPTGDGPQGPTGSKGTATPEGNKAGDGKPDKEEEQKPEEDPNGTGSGEQEEKDKDKDKDGNGTGTGKTEEEKKQEVTIEEHGTFFEPTHKDGSPLDESEKRAMENDLKTTIQSALNAIGTGLQDSEIKRILTGQLVKKIDVENEIKKYVDQALEKELTWKKPHKYMILHDIYAPSMKNGKGKLNVVFVIDSSSSVDDGQINYFLAKINNIIADYKEVTAHVISCNTRASYLGEFSTEDFPLKLNVEGYGGTRFDPPFKMVNDMDLDPKLLVYFTDLEAPIPEQAPDYPVIWAVFSHSSERFDGYQINFGEIVTITPDEMMKH